jgi:murein DD-endopeptidase MepM/ murein hydrolase activator NlpD
VRGARGLDATLALAQAEEELKTFEQELIGRTSNGMARGLLQRTITSRSAQELSNWSDYAVGEETRATDEAIVSRATSSREAALDHEIGSVEAQTNFDTGLGEIELLATRQGWAPGALAQKQLEYRSAYHAARVDQLYSRENVEAAQTYIDTHRSEMTGADEAAAVRTIRGELQSNRVEEDIAGAESVIYSDAAPDGAGGEGEAAAPASAGGSRGDRNNNPGNLVDGSFTRRQPGYQGSDGRFARFATRDQGEAAQVSLLANNYLNEPRTVRQIIDRYAPAGSENSTASRENYIRYVQEKLGVGADARLGAQHASALASAMREFETGNREGARYVAAPPPGEARWRSPVRTNHRTVEGGEFGAPRSYGTHRARDYSTGRECDPVYPMAHGRVVRVSRTGGGGNEVEIEYAGGYRSIYKHLQDGTTASLLVGQEVTPDDRVGAIGNTGTASRGAHLHGELVKPDGTKVDPESVVGGEAARLPSPVSGRRIDIARAEQYAREQVESGAWSRTRARLFTDGVRTRAGQEMQFRNAAESEIQRELNSFLDGRAREGQPLKDRKDIPPSLLRRVDQVPGLRQQIEGIIEQNNRPEPIRADGEAATRLRELMAEDPNGFVSAVESQGAILQSQMTPDEWAAMRVEAAQLRSNPNQGGNPTQILEAVRRWYPNAGLGADPNVGRRGPAAVEGRNQRAASIRQSEMALMARVRSDLAQLHGVRTPTQQDIMDSIISWTTPTTVYVAGVPVPGVPRYRTAEMGAQRWSIEIPNGAMPEIRTQLQRLGLPDTPQNRGQEYMRNRRVYDGIR